MRTKFIIIIVFSSFILSCSSTKTAATPEEIQVLDALVDSQAFTIKSDWAYPQASSGLLALQNSGLLAPGDSNASRFSLIGNPNFLKLSGDHIDSYLPYFGERQIITDRFDGPGIEFKNTVRDYQVIKNEDKYIIKFGANSKNENFRVIIEIFPNLKTEMMLKGAKRFPIRYSGKIAAISE